MSELHKPELSLMQLAQTDSYFGEAARLAINASADIQANTLDIQPSVLHTTGGRYLGVLVAAQSVLMAEGRAAAPRQYSKDRAVYNEIEHATMNASATMVALWPYANNGAGEASLFTVKRRYRRPPTQHMIHTDPFLGMVYGKDGMDVELDGIKHQRHGSRTFATNTAPIRLLASERTRIKPIVVGRQQLSGEVGLRAQLRGRANVSLSNVGLLRVGLLNKVYTVADEMEVAEIRLPENGAVQTDMITIPADGVEDYASLFAPDEDGYIRHGEQSWDRSNILSPTLTVDELATRLVKPIPWKDITDSFMDWPGMKAHVKERMGFDPFVLLDGLREDAVRGLEVEHKFTANKTVHGTVVVAELLRAMEHDHPTGAIDIDYFSR